MSLVAGLNGDAESGNSEMVCYTVRTPVAPSTRGWHIDKTRTLRTRRPCSFLSSIFWSCFLSTSTSIFDHVPPFRKSCTFQKITWSFTNTHQSNYPARLQDLQPNIITGFDMCPWVNGHGTQLITEMFWVRTPPIPRSRGAFCCFTL